MIEVSYQGSHSSKEQLRLMRTSEETSRLLFMVSKLLEMVKSSLREMIFELQEIGVKSHLIFLQIQLSNTKAKQLLSLDYLGMPQARTEQMTIRISGR